MSDTANIVDRVESLLFEQFQAVGAVVKHLAQEIRDTKNPLWQSQHAAALDRVMKASVACAGVIFRFRGEPERLARLKKELAAVSEQLANTRTAMAAARRNGGGALPA